MLAPCRAAVLHYLTASLSMHPFMLAAEHASSRSRRWETERRDPSANPSMHPAKPDR